MNLSSNYGERWSCKTHRPDDKTATASGLIDDIMKQYFCRKAGQGSSCSLFSNPKGSVYSMDKRLHYWSKIIEDRKRIACRIQRATGKRLSHVLYNQIEEHRKVQNVKRVMDIAQRLHPTSLSSRKTETIKETLFETLPRSERLRAPNFEIVGSPNVAMAEQWLHNCGDNAFLRSSYLQRKLKTDGTGLLEFYPDIDGLEVIGRRIHKHPTPVAEVISEFELSAVSSASKSDSWLGEEFPEHCLQVNETVLRGDRKPAETMTFHLEFTCTPYQRTTQTACKIKNVGRKPMNLHVRRVKPKDAAYLPPFQKAFHFNINSIRLGYGESTDIVVTFHSEERRDQADTYCLLTDPNLFDATHQILFELKGDCHLPQSYLDSMIGDLLDSVVGDIVAGTACAKARPPLTERQMFEKENPGFKCKPQDLRKLCEIYRQAKRKHHPSKWDMSLQSLKETIEGVPDFLQRTAYSDIFCETIREMRRRVGSSDSNINILLARTVIVANLDKWERKAVQIQRAVATTDIDLLVIKMPFDMIMEQIGLCRSERGKRRIILHNALYIQMFCCLCELAEDVVSYVENCLKLYTF